jgi:hypothetical protein
MFYVMPNYLTVDNQSDVKPASWKEKFAMAAKGSFDPYEFTIVGIVAGIRQAENSSPGFGQQCRETPNDIAISTLYYPASDRSFSSSLSNWGTQMGLDAFGNELKEFWLDIHHYLQRRQTEHLQRQQEKQRQKAPE